MIIFYRGGGIEQLKKYMLFHNWIGAAFQTRIDKADSNYWTYCANLRLAARTYEGKRNVIGTPYMFETDILRNAGYDETMTDADDSDIEKRISEMTGRPFGYSDLICYETGKTGLKETYKRFMIYGKSDAQYWNKYSSEWSLLRKVKSLMHPVKAEFLECMKGIHPDSLRIYAFPYLLFITVIRYFGWWKAGRDLRGAKQWK